MPVISGFTTAASVTIMSKQLRYILGLDITEIDTYWPGLSSTYAELIFNISTIKWPDMTLGISCIFLLLVLKYFPAYIKLKSKPIKLVLWYLSISRNALIVIMSMTLAYIFDGKKPFVLTGHITNGLPKWTLNIQWNFIETLGPALFTLPLITIIGHMAIAKSFSKALLNTL